MYPSLKSVFCYELLFACLSALLWSCGGGGGNGNSQSSPAPATPTDERLLASGLITVAAGGTVAVASPHPLAGTAIAIPPNSLATDTRISLYRSTLSLRSGFVGTIIDIEPDGTVFQRPARVTLVYNPADLPPGTDENTLLIAKVEPSGSLTLLSNIAVDAVAKTVSGDTTTLSKYVIVLPHTGGLNRPPVANAGADQQVKVGETVQLDGSGSRDADDDPLSYQWTLVTVPASSGAALSHADNVRPGFVADVPGVYGVQLQVSDGQATSAPVTMTLTAQQQPVQNQAPMAKAGPDQTVTVNTLVQLDGSGSSDPDGDHLSYHWSWVSQPAGSQATLSGADTVNPSFTVDQPGAYQVQLIVSGGVLNSAPATVMISTQNSPPVAKAGPDQTAHVGNTVQLDGSGSTDVDGNPLSYHWSLVSVPTGSTASLAGADPVRPTLQIDQPGDYVVRLIVNDGQADSQPAVVTIHTLNSPPVAKAGANRTVPLDSQVTLDGSGSQDVDGNPLSYRWALVTLPAGSQAVLDTPNGMTAHFVVDRPGTYVAQLIVNDGMIDLSYTADGLLTRFTDPKGNASEMTYDDLGRLLKDMNAAGGSQSLARSNLNNSDSYEVSRTTALNRTTTYRVEDLTTGNRKRVVHQPDGTETQTLIGTNGSTKTTEADGTVTDSLDGPDPRFGMQAPVTKQTATTTGGLTSTLTSDVKAELTDPGDPLSLTKLTRTTTLNGRTSTSIYDAATRKTTITSAAGRQSYNILDD